MNDDMQPSAVDSDESTKSTQVKTTKKKLSKRQKRWLIILGFLVIISAAAALWWFVLRSDGDTNQNTITTKPTKELKVVEAEDTTPLGRFISPKTGESWYSTPKQLSNLGLLKDADADNKYYWEVGTRGNNVIVFRDEPVPGEYVRVFEKTPDGTYHLIAQPLTTDTLTDEDRKDIRYDLRGDVQIDWDTHYDSLSMPKELDLGKGERVIREWGSIGTVPYASEGTKVTDVAKYGKSTLQQLEVPNANTGLSNIGYRMMLPTGRVVTLNYTPFTASLEQYTWKHSTDDKSKDEIHAIARGCGYLQGVTILPGLAKDKLEVVGATDKGANVYQLKDRDARLYQLSYDEYVKFVKDMNPEDEPITKDAFIDRNTIVIMDSPNNGLLVYIRNSLAPAYGCGKPVIYLYPTKTTTVSVRVDADVTVSDPYYPKGGWRNVTAEPSGRLTYRGVQYGSLFWEGTGYGQYPAITHGFVVPRDKAEETIVKQLQQQGLNWQEIDDFMEYWADKIPNRPYVRLSWLTKAQMDALAPLYLSETPDVTIRVFLDMSGLEGPVFMMPQTLTAPERRGFTVVEWGGLVNM